MTKFCALVILLTYVARQEPLAIGFRLQAAPHDNICERLLLKVRSRLSQARGEVSAVQLLLPSPAPAPTSSSLISILKKHKRLPNESKHWAGKACRCA